MSNEMKSRVEKDIEVAKKATNIIIEAAEIVTEAAADHVAGVLNGEKIDLAKEKERAVETMDKVADKADEYYGTVVDRVVEKFNLNSNS